MSFMVATREAVPALLDEVERLRALMPEVYRDGYPASVDGDGSDVLKVKERLDAYLGALPASETAAQRLQTGAPQKGEGRGRRKRERCRALLSRIRDPHRRRGRHPAGR